MISELQAGQAVVGTFLVIEFDTRKTAKGDPFTTMVVRDKTGSIACAPLWSNSGISTDGLGRGVLVTITGNVTLYKGDTRQLELQTLRIEHNPELAIAMLPTISHPIESVWRALDGFRLAIKVPVLRQVLDLFFSDPGFRAEFERCPGAVKGHHAAIGGLLLHTYEVVSIACRMAKVMNARVDLVVAMAMLHDIGKTRTYTVTYEGFGYTSRQLLTGHIVEGVFMLLEALGEGLAITEEQELELVHGILSHHGKLEHGSPVVPATLEAQLVNQADEASASGAAFQQELLDDSLFPKGPVGDKRSWMLNRKLWRSTAEWVSE